MLKQSQKLLIFSSDEEEEEDEKEKSVILPVHNQLSSRNHHRLEGASTKKNKFDNPESRVRDQTIEAPSKHNKKQKKIKYIGTVEHEYQAQIQRPLMTERQLSVSLSSIKKNNKKESDEERNEENSQVSASQTTKNLRNILAMNFNSESEEDQTSNEENDDQTSQIKDVKSFQLEQYEGEEEPPMEIMKMNFVKRSIQYNSCLRATIQRLDSGVNYLFPQLDCIFTEDLRHILSAKKQLGAKFEYSIYLKHDDIGDKQKVLGKVIANFSNSIFNFYQYCLKEVSITCTMRFIEQPNAKVVSPKCYEVFMLNPGIRYHSLVGFSKEKSQNLIDLFPLNRDKIRYYRNKKPQFNKEKSAFILNFDGRVQKGSIKNFIMQDEKSGREVLMFGKGNNNYFHMFVSHPFTPLQAMAIVIPHFASRIVSK